MHSETAVNGIDVIFSEHPTTSRIRHSKECCHGLYTLTYKHSCKECYILSNHYTITDSGHDSYSLSFQQTKPNQRLETNRYALRIEHS